MQATELDHMLSKALSGSEQNGLTLVIGNKKYSTWSMRAWLALVAFNIPFKEIRILLDQPDSSLNISKYSPAGRVPVLVAGGTCVWDSLAICEYLAEQFPEKNMWPRDVVARALARSVCAEMHAGFTGMRTSMWMNIGADFPGKGRTLEAQADIGRISEIWEDCFSKFGHHQFLFGDFSIADAYYAPVVMRFKIYGVSLAPALQAYVERVASHPAVVRWVNEAKDEIERLPEYDVYPD